jgi:hypothetical protein
MDKILSFVDIKKFDFENIKTLVADYYINNRIFVDSFWENHVRACIIYLMKFYGIDII